MRQSSSRGSSLRGSHVRPIPASFIREKLKGKTPLCSKCGLERLSHYCIEKKCPNKELLCIACDVNSSAGSHFLHRFCYILPLTMKAANGNMEDASEYIREYLTNVKQEVEKIQQYAKSFQGMLAKVEEGLAALQLEKSKRGLEKFQRNINSFIEGEDIDLKKAFCDVDFMTNAECKAKIEAFRKDMLGEINKLVWFADPMKGLRDILTEKDEHSQSQSQLQVPPASSDVKMQITFPSNKVVEISEIDQHFKQLYEVYTHKLQENPVVVKLDSEYSSKLRMFEALMYNFKKCRWLCINNINLNYIRSPLQFSRLRKLELVCNNECESYQHLKPETFASESRLTSFSIKKLKEEDSKFLRNVRALFPHLRELQVEFVNKFDMANNKDLNEFLKGTDPNLIRLSIKIRTEAEVKKLLGNFTKFYKETQENQLDENILRYLHRHTALTKLHLEGLRIVKIRELYESIRGLPMLQDIKLSLAETPDTLPHQVRLESQKIHKDNLHNRRAIALIQSMYIHGHIARVGARLFIEQLLEVAIGL